MKNTENIIVLSITTVLITIIASITYALVAEKLSGEIFQILTVTIVGGSLTGLLGFLGGKEYGTRVRKDIEIENGRLDYHSVEKGE